MPTRWPETATSAVADRAACALSLRNGSRSFFAASLLLPRSVRDPATSLYAFCREADDAIDLHGHPATALIEFRERLALAYAGCPRDNHVDRALATVLAEYPIAPTLPEALLEGMAWDAEGRQYETLSDLYAYAARVAGSVGVMMATIMGVRTPQTLARACDLGIAMQLTNIARDVGEDARVGRLYLPLAWLRAAGLDPASWLANPQFNDAVGGVVRLLLNAADHLYERAGGGISALPYSCQPGIFGARYLYAEIGREVERQAYDSVTRRAVVPAHRKLSLLCTAVAASITGVRDVSAVPLEEAVFLVEAATRESGLASAPDYRTPWWNFSARIGWVLALFIEINRRQGDLAPRTHQPAVQEGGPT